MNGTSFPPLLKVIEYDGPFFWFGPVLLLSAAGLWGLILFLVFHTIRARLRMQEVGKDAWKGVLFLGLFFTFWASAGVFCVYDTCRTVNDTLWWQIKPEEVAEIEVVRCPGVDDALAEPVVGPPVYIRDQAVLRDGFGLLAGARCYRNYHESYQDGYRLRIRKVGEANFSERYLFVFRRSDKHQELPVVVVQRGPGPYSGDSVPCEFLSPAFLKWVAEIADPRFAVPPQ